MGCILVIEDSLPQLSRIASILRSAGHEVHEAEDWAQCRAALQEISPDLVLLDVNLSGMQGGDILTIQLRKHPKLKDARLVLHSASKEADLKVMMLRSGANGYIIKGKPERDFLREIQAFLPPRPRT
jgi:CheY-like chemotaxis protein